MDNRALRQLNEFNKIWCEFLELYTNVGFTLNQKIMYYMLEQEENGEEATQKGLCEVWVSNKQTINSGVKRLEDAGMITRVVSSEDKRRKSLKLTEAGREYAYKVVIPMRKAEVKAFSKLNAEDVEQMLQNMRKLVISLEEEYPK